MTNESEQELDRLRIAASRWEDYRNEMMDMERRMAKLARNFLALGAYEDAAKCATRAEGMRFELGRPKFGDADHGLPLPLAIVIYRPRYGSVSI